ncbi:hypothetical protein P3X46_035217, partial [Hevea brasiliensis]
MASHLRLKFEFKATCDRSEKVTIICDSRLSFNFLCSIFSTCLYLTNWTLLIICVLWLLY